jgi:hypothetical protein
MGISLPGCLPGRHTRTAYVIDVMTLVGSASQATMFQHVGPEQSQAYTQAIIWNTHS